MITCAPQPKMAKIDRKFANLVANPTIFWQHNQTEYGSWKRENYQMNQWVKTFSHLPKA
jgi:hypothetical protein